jgi:hypothetical protein
LRVVLCFHTDAERTAEHVLRILLVHHG